MLPVLAKSGLARSFIPNFLNFGFIIAIAGGAYLLLKKVMDTIRRNQTIKDYGDNTQSGIAAAYAAQFYNAMVRTAGWWSDWFGDGTNADVIFSTAAEMYRNKIPFRK